MSAPLDAAIRAGRTTAHWMSGSDEERFEAIVKSAILAFINDPHLGISYECQKTLRAHLDNT